MSAKGHGEEGPEEKGRGESTESRRDAEKRQGEDSLGVAGKEPSGSTSDAGGEDGSRAAHQRKSGGTGQQGRDVAAITSYRVS